MEQGTSQKYKSEQKGMHVSVDMVREVQEHQYVYKHLAARRRHRQVGRHKETGQTAALARLERGRSRGHGEGARWGW